MILITGAAGFIGFHLSLRLLRDGQTVQGLDNLSEYYDVALKHARLKLLSQYSKFSFCRLDLADAKGLGDLFARTLPDYVVNLAAQAGVRYALVNPQSYVDSNIIGFLQILECCRHSEVKHLIFASSSSIYGLNTVVPYSEHHNVNHPLSLYAATKRTNELMAHTYSHLYGFPVTGLRFFSVYGPWGRPDMALFLFTKAILEGKAIEVYDQDRMERDFTYIDDIVEGIVRLIFSPAKANPGWDGSAPDPASSCARYRIYNIGNQSPVKLARFIEIIEECLGKKAIKNHLPIQASDIPISFAAVADLAKDVGFIPTTSVETGIERFVKWYRDYYLMRPT